MPFDATLLIPLIGGLLALVCVIAAQRQMRCLRLLQDLPTSKTTGIFIGLVEVKGTAEAEQPLNSYLAEKHCVYYAWNVAERWSRTVTETYRDSDGNMKTRTRHESGWTTVAEGTEATPFYVRDDCGVVRVVPDRAKIDATEILNETCYPIDAFYYAKGPPHAIGNSDHVRRFTEIAIPLHAPVYVVGQARERMDLVAPEIAHDVHAPLFLISTREERRLVSGHRWALIGLLALGLVLCGGAFYVYGRARDGVDWPGWLIAAAMYLLIASLAWAWTSYNSLIGLRQRVRRAWATVEVHLKRRHDLIPELVRIVSALSDHERNVQTAVAQLRNQLRATPPGAEGPDYEALSGRLVAFAEDYPRIAAQPLFLQLQKELAGSEERIALARGYYNEIVSYWNTRLAQMPDGLLAWLCGMRREQLLEARGFERESAEVTLA